MKTKFKTLANLQAADVAAIAIRSLVQSIRNATPSLKAENMDTALAYYDVTVGECAKSPIELGLTLQTVQSAGTNPSPADSFLLEFISRVACSVSGARTQPMIHQHVTPRTHVEFRDGAIQLESATASAMQCTIPLAGIDHPVFFTVLGWGANIVHDLIVGAQLRTLRHGEFDAVSAFIRKHAKLLKRTAAPETWFMTESEHKDFWDDLRGIGDLMESDEGMNLLRTEIGGLNGSHSYPDIHGFVNNQTMLLDVTGRNGDLCTHRHFRKPANRDGEYFPVDGSVVASWMTFCMCDPIVFLSAFAQIHSPLVSGLGDAIDLNLFSMADVPLPDPCDEWELPEVYSIRHAAS